MIFFAKVILLFYNVDILLKSITSILESKNVFKDADNEKKFFDNT